MPIMQLNRKLFVLSDSKRIGRFSNIVTVKKTHSHRYFIPVFELKHCLEYVKQISNHPYHIVKIDINELKKHIPKNTDVYVICNIYCDTDTKKEVIDYHILSL
jgi:hypothetical protein